MVKKNDGVEPEKKKAKKAASRAGDTCAAVDEGAPVQKQKVVRNFKRHTNTVISGGFARIMKTMAEKSVAGSLAHTKFLFEIGGVKEEIERQRRSKKEPSLASLLIAEVRKQREAMQAQVVDGETVDRQITDGEGDTQAEETEIAERENDEQAE